MIINDQIDYQNKRRESKNIREIIRDTLELIETKIRFEAVRLFGCYNALLVHALTEAQLSDYATRLPPIPLFLELGACDKTMISFISLGLSRVSAMKLNEASARKNLDSEGALKWLKSRDLESLGLSPLLLEEVASIIKK